MKIKKILILFLTVMLTGCATTHQKTSGNLTSNWEKEPQIEKGSPNIIVDSIGNITGIPAKILLLNPKIESHSISPGTVKVIETYIKDNPERMKYTKVRINQFTPVGEFKRLMKNKKVSWWWRIFPGIPVTMLSLAGRLVGGDHYNPYTDTINIYSDVSSVALHEAGHAVDFSEHAERGTAGIYAVGRMLIPVTLHQEYVASEKAINYVKDTKDRKGEKEAYKTLYPAYGTYVGGSTGIPFANVAGAAVGHVVGIVPRYNAKIRFAAQDNARWGSVPVQDLALDPVNKSLMEDYVRREEVLNGIVLAQETQSQKYQIDLSKGGPND